jgi:heterotetrameric sarcosine oxidase gamma subunit
MAESVTARRTIPVARSPIPVAPPESELADWAVSGRRSDAALTIADWTPLAKLLVRAPSAAPDGGGLLVRWGPDEWLAFGPPGSQSALRDRLGRTDGTVVDVTHAYALLRLTGDQAADVLAHECALDLSRPAPHGPAPHASTRDASAGDGSALRTSISGVAAGLIRDDVGPTLSYLMTCEWSLGHYLFESLFNAGHDDGIRVDGLRMTKSQWAIRNTREC